MNKWSAVYQALAAALGLHCDVGQGVIYGKKGEYDILIYAERWGVPFALTIHASAKRSMALTKKEKKEYTGVLRQVASIRQEGYRIIVQQKNISDQEKLQTLLVQSVDSLLSFLRFKGFQPCCSVCGQSVEAEPYLVDDDYVHLCPNCTAGMRDNPALVTRLEKNKKENVAAGTVGALLGSLFGLLFIVLLRRMNFVSAGSGLIMAVGVLWGYKRRGKKFTKKGIVISVLIMLIMTYVADRLDWTFRLYSAVKPEASFFECYRLIPILLQEGIINKKNYISNLAGLYFILLVGAVPGVYVAAKGNTTAPRIVKVGGYSFFKNK